MISMRLSSTRLSQIQTKSDDLVMNSPGVFLERSSDALPGVQAVTEDSAGAGIDEFTELRWMRIKQSNNTHASDRTFGFLAALEAKYNCHQ
jgi:hypothetical protein